MSFEIQREYRLKFYLNAQHYFVDPATGKKGETHPHTWELTLRIAVLNRDYTPFHLFEQAVEDYLAPYQNKVLNDCPPFDVVTPSIEGITEMFARDFDGILSELGGQLRGVEGSEGPTRSIIVTIKRLSNGESSRERQAEALSDVIDNVLDGISQ